MKDFKQFWTDLPREDRAKILASVKPMGMCANSVYLIARGERPAGIHSVARLMKADKRISFKMMRPDLF